MPPRGRRLPDERRIRLEFGADVGGANPERACDSLHRAVSAPLEVLLDLR